MKIILTVVILFLMNLHCSIGAPTGNEDSIQSQVKQNRNICPFINKTIVSNIITTPCDRKLPPYIESKQVLVNDIVICVGVYDSLFRLCEVENKLAEKDWNPFSSDATNPSDSTNDICVKMKDVFGKIETNPFKTNVGRWINKFHELISEEKSCSSLCSNIAGVALCKMILEANNVYLNSFSHSQKPTDFQNYKKLSTKDASVVKPVIIDLAQSSPKFQENISSKMSGINVSPNVTPDVKKKDSSNETNAPQSSEGPSKPQKIGITQNNVFRGHIVDDSDGAYFPGTEIMERERPKSPLSEGVTKVSNGTEHLGIVGQGSTNKEISIEKDKPNIQSPSITSSGAAPPHSVAMVSEEGLGTVDNQEDNTDVGVAPQASYPYVMDNGSSLKAPVVEEPPQSKSVGEKAPSESSSPSDQITPIVASEIGNVGVSDIQKPDPKTYEDPTGEDDDDDDVKMSEDNLAQESVLREPEGPKALSDLSDSEDSSFFTYFILMSGVCVIFYLGYHHKVYKVLAHAFDGRRSRGGGGRHSASYRKLHSNLEEAIASNSPSAPSTTNLLY